MRILYSFLLSILLPFIVLRLWLRGFSDRRYRQRWRERFGYVQSQDAPVIWLHAVSVGEVRAASALVQRMMASYPQYRWHITTTTPTGAEMAGQLLGDALSHSYFPYDIPWFVNRFLGQLRPSLVLIMETEIWPNLFHACRQRQIPLCILNARMSEQSFSRYGKFSRLTQQTLQNASLVTVSSESDRKRFIKLGLDPERINCPGNLKFDIELDQAVLEKAEVLRSKWGAGRSIWVAGSTHPGEESVVLAAHQQVLKQYPHALLILVPRHPERAEEIARLCASLELSCVYSSSSVASIPTCQVVIGDRLGELPLFYAASDVAFVGGSLVLHGGQNPLEAAVAARPVLSGVSVTNFADVYQKLKQAGAVVTINDSTGLARHIIAWFADPAAAKVVGQTARQVIEYNRGTVKRTLTQLREKVFRKEDVTI